jgi:hypothetical protein
MGRKAKPGRRFSLRLLEDTAAAVERSAERNGLDFNSEVQLTLRRQHGLTGEPPLTDPRHATHRMDTAVAHLEAAMTLAGAGDPRRFKTPAEAVTELPQQLFQVWSAWNSLQRGTSW